MLSQLKNHAEINNSPLFALITLKILNTIFSVFGWIYVVDVAALLFLSSDARLTSFMLWYIFYFPVIMH